MTIKSFSRPIGLKIWVKKEEKLVLNSEMPIKFLLLSESVLNFRRVTGILDLGECLSLVADDLQSAVYLSTVQTPKPSSENLGLMRYRGDLLGHLVSTDGYFMFAQFGVKQAQIFGCSCSRRKGYRILCKSG